MTSERFHILEPCITSPFREEFTSCYQGVAILIFNRNGDILLVQENHDDERYGRKKGHWNILTETRELNEGLDKMLNGRYQKNLDVITSD
ncbi:MAG TPA: hypothetical protein VMR81_03730 [Patescibacteria group bacterium]|jgi:hypothetical protein|nr:hypothetical protein [Patescibacteria group bacterium]